MSADESAAITPVEPLHPPTGIIAHESQAIHQSGGGTTNPANIAGVPFVEPKKAGERLVRAQLSHLKFVDSLQHKFGKSLGFLPFAALEANLVAGNVILCNENDDEAGYILARPVLGWQPQLASIVQAAVCMDAQRRHHGLAMLLLIEKEAKARGQVGIQACCAIGVEANEFWQAAGFKPIAHMTPNTKSGREVICWRKPLVRSLPSWFTDLPARAGHRCRVPQSNRNADRAPQDQKFAEKFLQPRHFTGGDVTAPSSGLITPDSAEGQRIMKGE